jgi:hypothetical protein
MYPSSPDTHRHSGAFDEEAGGDEAAELGARRHVIEDLHPLRTVEQGTQVWVSRLEGHLRTQGYEDADGNALGPLVYKRDTGGQ